MPNGTSTECIHQAQQFIYQTEYFDVPLCCNAHLLTPVTLWTMCDPC